MVMDRLVFVGDKGMGVLFFFLVFEFLVVMYVDIDLVMLGLEV